MQGNKCDCFLLCSWDRRFRLFATGKKKEPQWDLRAEKFLFRVFVFYLVHWLFRLHATSCLLSGRTLLQAFWAIPICLERLLYKIWGVVYRVKYFMEGREYGVFERNFHLYKNERNSAASFITRAELSKMQGLTLVFHCAWVLLHLFSDMRYIQMRK